MTLQAFWQKTTAAVTPQCRVPRLDVEALVPAWEPQVNPKPLFCAGSAHLRVGARVLHEQGVAEPPGGTARLPRPHGQPARPCRGGSLTSCTWDADGLQELMRRSSWPVSGSFTGGEHAGRPAVESTLSMCTWLQLNAWSKRCARIMAEPAKAAPDSIACPTAETDLVATPLGSKHSFLCLLSPLPLESTWIVLNVHDLAPLQPTTADLRSFVPALHHSLGTAGSVQPSAAVCVLGFWHSEGLALRALAAHRGPTTAVGMATYSGCTGYASASAVI